MLINPRANLYFHNIPKLFSFDNHLQKQWRCHRDCSCYKKKKRASIIIQCRLRGKIARKDLRKLKKVGYIRLAFHTQWYKSRLWIIVHLCQEVGYLIQFMTIHLVRSYDDTSRFILIERHAVQLRLGLWQCQLRIHVQDSWLSFKAQVNIQLRLKQHEWVYSYYCPQFKRSIYHSWK